MIYPLRGAKDVICRVGLGSRLIEYCHRCGKRQPLTWWTDDRMWRAVTGSAGGAYCPECFDHLALKRLGVLLRWAPVPSSAPDDIELCGMRFVFDRSVPRNEMHVKNNRGETLAKVRWPGMRERR